MKLSLRSKLILLVFSVSVPLFLTTILSNHYDRKKIINHQKQEMLHSAWRVAGLLERFLETSKDLFGFLGEIEAVRGFDRGETEKIFRGVIQNFKGIYTDIYSLDKEGNVIATGTGRIPEELRRFKDTPVYQRAIQGDKLTIGDPEISPISGHVVFYLAQPLMSVRGEITGLMVFSVDPERVEDFWAPPNIPNNSVVSVITSDRVIIVANPKQKNYEREKAAGACFQIVFSQPEGAREVTCDFDGVKRVIGFTKLLRTNWTVLVSVPSYILFGSLRTDLIWRLTLYSLMFVAAVVWSFYYTKSIYKRVKGLQISTERIAKGELESKIEPSGSDEIGDLADSMEYMRRSLLKSQQSLLGSERRYRELVETSRALLVTHDMVGKILSVNKEACKALGYSPEEVIGQNIKEIMAESVRHLFPEYLREIKEKGKASGLISLLHRGGEKEVWAYHNTLIHDNPASPIVYSTGFDITQHIKLEKALKESEERYRQIVELSPMAICIYQDDTVVFANQAALDLLKYERPEELLHKPVMDIIYPEDREMVRQRIRKALQQNRMSPLKEERFLGNDGNVALAEVTAIPFSYAKKPAVLVLAQDITLRKQAEQALRETENYFQALFNSVPEAVLVIDMKSYRILAVNDVMVSRYGYSREEFLNMDATQIRPPEDINKFKEALGKELSGIPEYVGEFFHRKKDGTTFPVLIYRQRLDLRSGPAFVTVAVDNTERAQVEEERVLLAKASEVFNTTFDLEEILGRVTKITAGVIGDGCAICLKEEGREFLRMASLNSVMSKNLELKVHQFIKNQPLSLSNTYMGKVAITGQSILIEDTQAVDKSLEYFQALSLKTFLAVPIRSKEKVLGVLACSSVREGSRFGHRELRLAQQLADRAAMAIENAKLFKNIELLEEKRRALFEYASDAIFILDLEGTILEANENACKSLGYTLEELIGMNVAEIKSPRSAIQVRGLIDALLEKKHLIFEHENRRKNGSVFPVEISTRLIELPDRTVIQSITRDITERKKAEEELKSRTELNKVLMDSLPFVAMIIKTGSQEIIAANKAAIDNGAVPGKTCYASWWAREQPCPGCQASLAWSLDKPQHKEIEIQGVVWDGYWVPLGQDQYLHYVFDITERKRMEKQLLQAQKMEAIGQLAGGIAHDFNNILSGITGYTSLMKMKMDQNHPFFHGISVIEKSSWRAAELTQQLLGFARGGKYEIKQININQMVDTVLSIVRETFDRAIEIKTHLYEDIWTVEGDQGQMEQILLNLCLNARDAMPVGGRLLIETSNVTLDEAYVRSHLGAKAGDYVLLSVTDSGIGIPYAVQNKIFEPFFTTKEFGKGTGMGLAMAYGIVKNHEGHITVYSEPGKGCCFRVYLPAIKIEILDESITKDEVVLRGKETILLVDDEEIVRELGKTILQELGYRVILAKDGQEACNIFVAKGLEIDLVILDMIMPVMGGKETYLRLKEINSQVKVLLSSGYSINGQVQETLKEGIEGFIQKPYNMQDLARSIRKALMSV